MVEFALISPLLLLVLTGMCSVGVWAYALVCVENAARSAALRNSAGVESAVDQAQACRTAIDELRGLPNIGASFSGTCGGAPLVVSSVLCSGSGACAGAAGTADGARAAAVTIRYTLPSLFTFPAAGPGEIVRTARMKVVNIP